jgi:hypothetical protein
MTNNTEDTRYNRENVVQSRLFGCLLVIMIPVLFSLIALCGERLVSCCDWDNHSPVSEPSTEYLS